MIADSGGPVDARAARHSTGGAAALVGIGILGSRVLGLARQILVAGFLGADIAADAFTAAIKIPNTLQNLFGEGALSAAFIPVYSRLLANGDDADAGRLAGAVAAILGLLVAVLVLAGLAAAPVLLYVINPGFTGEKRALTISLIRILFPGVGILVLSAWCLGILNSHRKFLVSYSAPMAWNVAMIVALVRWGGDPDKARVVTVLAWASVAGSVLQLVVQLPSALAVVPRLKLALDTASANVREVLRNFGPVFVSLGVVQISSYVDQWFTGWMPDGMVALFGYATTLYTLPVSLFGRAVSAAELPEMSRTTTDAVTGNDRLRFRLDAGLRRIAFFVVPSAVAFFALGDVLTRVIFQRGRFTALDTMYMWGILAGSGVGLLAGTLGRLYASTYYALRDTRTPLNFALLRVLLTTALGAFCAFPLPRMLGLDPRWGAAGLTVSAGIAGWVEFVLLRSRLNARIGVTGLTARFTLTLWSLAIVSAGIALAVKAGVQGLGGLVGGCVVIATYGVVYLGGSFAIGVPEVRILVRGVMIRVQRKRG